MDHILIFEKNIYKEYPFEDLLDFGKFKVIKKNHKISVHSESGVEECRSSMINHIIDREILYLKADKRTYERKDCFSIEDQSGDIQIKGYTGKVFIKNNTVFVDTDGPPIYLNDCMISRRECELEEGDSILANTVRVTFFDRKIEVEGDYNDYETNLNQIKNTDFHIEGFPKYARSPRVIRRIKDTEIEIVQPPEKSTLSRESLTQIIVPPLLTAGATITLSLLMGRGSYVLMSAGMTVVSLGFSIHRFFSEKKKNKEKNERRQKVYDRYLLNIRKQIRNLRAEERKVLEYQFPTIGQLNEMINDYSSRVYERSILDEDFLTIHLGYCSGESSTKITFVNSEIEMETDELLEDAKSIRQQFREISNKPVAVDLKKAHLGLVGDKENIHAQLKNILMRLTFFHSYHDLEIICVYDEKYSDTFNYLRWYPHLKISAININGQINNEQKRDQILGSLHQIIKDRKLKLEENKQVGIFTPHYLFVIDEPKLLLNHSIMEYLQLQSMALGFSMIYTTNQKANLPENIHTVCVLEDSTAGTLLMNEGEMVSQSFELERFGEINLDQSARDLGVLIHEKGMVSQIPDSITFFEMYRIEHPQELNVAQRWKTNESHKTLAVPLGVRAKEDYVYLNLHEKVHGPHGLVAGTTGSGKSEIVQSYILSLAVNFHPYEVGFLLIDYKGGGMAGLFEKLPHLLGTITNLDGAESIRAMVSIKSELARRQRIFSECSVNHINGYNQLFKLGKVKEPLPHLFLISDEFAELKKEQPEFMTELVSAARIGRSLGIHLILATQKPSGVVDDQIWTNSKFKLCLKVQNESDSREMLKTSDAANITQAGRSYLQVGNNEIYELFQSAWSGAAYSDEKKLMETDNRVWKINALGQAEVINQDLSGGDQGNQIKATQLDVVVDHIQHVFETQGLEPVKRPWLPSLPNRLVSPGLETIVDTAVFEVQKHQVKIGMVDIPEEQRQEEYLLDFVKNGHVVYIASSGFGKTVFLSTVMLSLAAQNSVKNLNMYIFDFGNSGLIPYRGLPHTADYFTIDDMEKIKKFMVLINQEVRERKNKLAVSMSQNFEVYNQSVDDKLKAIVIIVDNFDVVREMGYDLEEFFQKLSRDSAGLGVFLAISATRSNGIKYAILNNFKVKIAGYNFEEGEVRGIVGRSEYTLPEIKGRAMVKLDNVNVMQIYVPVNFTTEVEYSEKIRAFVQNISLLCSEEKAIGIPILPEVLEYAKMPTYPGYVKSDRKIPLGIDVDKLGVQYMDLSEPIQLIIGGSQTGKTNCLKHILYCVQGQSVYLADSSAMELYSYSSMDRVTYAAEENTLEELLNGLKQEAERREEQYLVKKTETPGLIPRIFYQNISPVYIIIDQIQDFMEKVEKLDEDLVDQILISAMRTGIIFIVTSGLKLRGRTEFLTLLKDAKNGLILGDITDQSIFSSSGFKQGNNQIDIGYLHIKGENTKIKIPRSPEPNMTKE